MNNIYCDSVLLNIANIATIVMAIAAIIAGILAFKNITVLKEQRRIDTFLRLLDQMSSQRERDNRDIVYRLWVDRQPFEGLLEEPNIGKRIAKLIDDARYLQGREEQNPGIRRKDAIEETVACFDKIGFFLLGNPPKLRVDPRLKEEAPIWIWSTTSEMWNKLGEYVKGVQRGDFTRKVPDESIAIPNYGKYFEALNKKAIENNPQKSQEVTHVPGTG